MKTDPFAPAGRSVGGGTPPTVAVRCANGVDGACAGVLAGSGATVCEFADLQPVREVAR